MKIIFLLELCAILLRIQSIDGKLTFTYGIHHVQESGSNCILKLAANHFQVGSIVGVLTSGLKNITTNFHTAMTTEHMILKNLMEQNQWSLMTKKSLVSIWQTENINFFEKVHNYVIFVKTTSDLASILNYVSKRSSWNPHAKIIIYMDIGIDYENEKSRLLKQLIQISWKYWIINLTMVVPDQKYYLQRIITWFPFDEGNCGKQEIKIFEMGNCSNSELIPATVNYFPEKVPTNLNNCPVKVATVVWPPFVLQPKMKITSDEQPLIFEAGIEIELIKTIAKKANFSIAFRSFVKPEFWGYITSRENSTGVMDLLYRGYVDIAIGTMTPTYERHLYFDFTVQYMQDKITWIVPTAEIKPHWQNLTTIFQPCTWGLSLCVYLIVSIIIWLLGRSMDKYSEFIQFRTLDNTFLITWRMMVGSATENFPKSMKLRLFVLLWSLYCIHWYTAYTTSLISVLMTQFHGEQISNFDDILKFGLEFGITKPTLCYFEDGTFAKGDLGDLILLRRTLCHSSPACMDRIARQKDFAMALSRQYFAFAEHNYHDSTGNPLLKVINEDIVAPPIEMLLVKGYPLLPRINALTLSIIEAGLIQVWETNIKKELDENKYDTQTETQTQQVLTINHLEGAFMALGVGLLIATICFLFEICMANIKRNT